MEEAIEKNSKRLKQSDSQLLDANNRSMSAQFSSPEALIGQVASSQLPVTSSSHKSPVIPKPLQSPILAIKVQHQESPPILRDTTTSLTPRVTFNNGKQIQNVEPFSSQTPRVTSSLTPRVTSVCKIEMPIFDGSNAFDGIAKVENFSTVGAYTEEEKMGLDTQDVAIPQVVDDQVTETDLNNMLRVMDSVSFNSFDENQGFSPIAIAKRLIIAQKKNKIPEDQFLKDITTMCAIAVMKGSVTDNNFKKMSAAGQQELANLEITYGIKRGSGRGKSPNVVTISRIAATFPEMVIKLIALNKVPSRTFFGPLMSHTLPAVMRHEAFAAVIPKAFPENVKEFLLNLVTAFSVDKSICINPNKKARPEVTTLFDTQRRFIQIAADSSHPQESARVKIFRGFINLNYDDMITCARALQVVNPSFKFIEREELVAAFEKL